MEALFLRVVWISLTCSAVLVPLLVGKGWLRHHVRAKALYVVWLILALRLVIPVDLSLPETKILQAEINILNGQKTAAKRLLATIEDKEDLDTMINVAYMYINTFQPGEALKWLEPGIGKYEDDEPFMAVLGDAYFGLGMTDEAMEVYVDSLGPSSIILTARGWTRTEDYWRTKWDLTEAVKYAFDEAGIEIPYNKLDVNVLDKK